MNNTLKNQFGLRAKGPIVFRERGPGLLAVVDALREGLEAAPRSVILQKWLDDLIRVALPPTKGARSAVRNTFLWFLIPD